MIKPIKFEKGGKSEKATDIDIIKGIQNLLGANDEEMEQLLQAGIKKYGSIGKIGEAIQESVSNLPQGYSYEDVANAVMQVFSPEESQMFKCGGKMQQLVSKHSKGNKVDCGCGGTKIAFGEDGFSDGMPKGTRRITAQKDTVETYPLGNIAEVTRKSYFGKPDVDYNVMYDNATRRVSTNPVLLNNIGVFALPFVSAGLASDRITPEYQKQLESARNNTDFEVKEKKNGGTVKCQEGAEITPDTTNPFRRKMLSFIDDTPALRHIQQGFNNFKQSAPGKVLSFFMPDPKNGAMAMVPGFKINNADKVVSLGEVGKDIITKNGKKVVIVPEGVYGSSKAAQRAMKDPWTYIDMSGKDVAEDAKKINGLRKWLYGGWYNATTNLPK